jgi:hypothetical protein
MQLASDWMSNGRKHAITEKADQDVVDACSHHIRFGLIAKPVRPPFDCSEETLYQTCGWRTGKTDRPAYVTLPMVYSDRAVYVFNDSAFLTFSTQTNVFSKL